VHLGSHMAYSVSAAGFYVQCDSYLVLYSIIVVLTAIYSDKVNIDIQNGMTSFKKLAIMWVKHS